jgi:hypothetical protein
MKNLWTLTDTIGLTCVSLALLAAILSDLLRTCQ